MDPETHKKVEKIIETNLLRTPAESIYQFDRAGSGVHVNVVSMVYNKQTMTFLIVNNGDTKVEIILKGCQEPYIEL